MSIHPLPAHSIRALTSGQALTSPPSLIKELLDNSLDAHATHLSIELSSNTLDILQVKDNGHGIPPDDRGAMAVRHCTSKIRDFNDIASCRTLGFRGEALASAAEMAGSGMTITTRVEGEKVAMCCTVDKTGAVVGRRPVGAAVGTTVRVEGFLKGLPVRRENALKGAPKSIAKLRALLQRYYLSYPHCRFSLRILAAQGSKGRTEDVVYAPSKTVPEAVQKAVGKDVAAACEWISTSSEDAEEQSIALEAFLPKPTAPPGVIAKKPLCTNFVYVDSRAVSCARGTLKQVLALYKTYLKAALEAPGVSDPFIYLNIRCPPGSYDPNIEPAKDDVMFHDSGAVLAAVEGMLKRFYGELKSDDNSSSRSTNKGKAVEAPRNGFELLLARKPKAAPAVETPRGKRSSSRRPYVRPVQEVEYDEDEEELAAREMDAVMDSGDAGLVGVDSPPRRPLLLPAVMVEEEEEQDQIMGGTEEAEEAAAVGPASEVAPVEKAPLPEAGTVPVPVPVTPRRKSTNWGFNMYGGADDEDNDDDDAYIPMEPTASDNEETAQRDITISNPWTAAKINSPIARSSPQRQLRRPFKPPSVVVSPVNRRSSRGRADAPISPAASSPGGFRGDSAVKARKGGDGNAAVMGSWISGSRRKGQEPGEASPPAARKGFVSAAKFYHDNPTTNDDDDEDDDDAEPHRRRPQQAPKRRRLNQDPEPADEPEPALASPPKSSPHKNRFLAAMAALHSPAQQTTLTGELPVLLPPPAQARRTKSRRRTKTLLPLDAVPEVVMQTHMLRCSVAVDGTKLKEVVEGLRAWDGYVGGAAAATVAAGKGDEGGEAADEVDDGAFWCEGGEREGDAGVLGGVVERWLARFGVSVGGWEWRGSGSGSGEEEEGRRVLVAVDG